VIDADFALKLLDMGRTNDLRAYLKGWLPIEEEDDLRERYGLPAVICPVCGGTRGQHEKIQEIANSIRKDLGLPPVDPPDMQTGFQKR
jgi:hypothetical protein